MLRIDSVHVEAAKRHAAGGVKAAARLLFPPCCACCGDDQPDEIEAIPLCHQCIWELAAEPLPRCRRCAAEIAPSADPSAGCLRCRRLSSRLVRVVALGNHDDHLRRAVLRIKQPHAEPLAAALADLLVERRGEALTEMAPDVVVPVPMHWARRAARGTNSAHTIAARLARALGVPLAGQALRRRRNTKPQAGLPLKQRLANVRNAFVHSAGYDFHGARVVLVDDVMTTGATLGESAKVLAAAGAQRVFAAVLARAHGPN